MVLSTLIQKNSLLVGSVVSVLSMKIISQSFINALQPSLKKCWWKYLVGCSPICCVPLATFAVVPLESESINCGTYKLNTTNLTWKKVNQAFAITIERVVYIINFLGHKTLKVSVSFMLQQVSHLLFPPTKCAFSLISE